MQSHLLFCLLFAATGCTPGNITESDGVNDPLSVPTHNITLANGVTIDDITKTNFSSPELETIRLGLISGGNVILTESEKQRLDQYKVIADGEPERDPAITTFINQLSW